MSALKRVGSLVAILLVGAGCSSGDPVDVGRGTCDLKTVADPTLVVEAPTTLPDGTTPAPQCDRSLGALPNPDSCVCGTRQDAIRNVPDPLNPGGTIERTNLLDPAAQFAVADRRSGCKVWAAGDCSGPGNCFFQTDPVGCYQLGFVDGFITGSVSGIGGSGHDGDEHMQLCPIRLGVHDGMNARVDKDVDLRAISAFQHANSHEYGRLDAEVQWCRAYGGPFAVAPSADVAYPAPAASWPEFRPQAGERVSVVGDWVVDSSWTEVHETRISATVRQDPASPDTWHLLTSGFFAKDTAQQNVLSITVPVPPSTTPGHSKLKCLKAVTTSGGCAPSFANFQDPVEDSINGTCTIRILRDQTVATDDSTSARYCGETHRANEAQFQCPCFGKDGAENPDDQPITCSARGIATFDDYDRCTLKGWSSDIFGSHESASAVTRLAFAGDVRAMWVDPDDAWSCVCACDDPSQPGATIDARVQGCAMGGLSADEDEEMAEACEQACGGHVCGEAQSCRIGSCRATAVPEVGASLVARDACHVAVPENRVARAANYEVQFDPTLSRLELGTWELLGFVPQLDAPVALKGFAYFNRTGHDSEQQLEFADFELTTDAFVLPTRVVGIQVGSIPVTSAGAFVVARFHADLGPRPDDQPPLAQGEFTIPAGQMSLAVRGASPLGTGGAEFLNAGPFRGSFDPTGRTFTLSGVGTDEVGHAARLSLVGTVRNTPPHAVVSGSPVVECTSAGTTSIQLGGLASFDDDSGDAIAHYQWFEGATGLSNAATLNTSKPLGSYVFDLHVYDRDLGSDSQNFAVSIVDTRGPSLELGTGVLCLWPPNHEFALFRLGEELQFETNDTCDAAPSVRIISVQANEPIDGNGDGATSPDVVFGPTSACIRSERAGGGLGRTYFVTIEARDRSGNTTRRVKEVVVPHDRSSSPQCTRATGIDQIDARCSQ